MSKKIETEPKQEANDTSIQDALNMMPSQEELLASLPEKEEKAEASEKEITEEPVKEPETNKVEFEKPSETREFSEIEKEALDKGWKPEWKEDGWISAGEYLKRKEMLTVLGEQQKEINQMRKAHEEMIGLIKQDKADAFEEQAQDVLKQKREAIQQGDVEAAEGYEKKYHDLQTKAETFKPKEGQETPSQEIQQETKDFIARHRSWFNNDTPENKAMTIYAIDVENQLMKENPHWSTYKRLEEVERRVKEFYSHRFENPNRNRAPKVESKSYSVKKDPQKITFDELPNEAKQVINNFKKFDRGKGLSRDEYAQKLLDMGVIEL